MADNLAHKRIDEGVARGKRHRRSAPLRRSAGGQLEAIPAHLDPQEVLKRYLDAPTSSWVARELGIRRSTLSKWLRDTVPAEWKAVQVIRADMRKEDGDDGIYGARDALELARAREVLKSAQWDLERLDSANYGQKQELTITAQPILNITITAPQQPNPVIDLQPDAVQQLDKPKP